MVLIVVDRFSMYAHFIPLGHLYPAASIAKVFFDKIVKLHGISCSIVSDHGLPSPAHYGRSYFISPASSCGGAQPFTCKPTSNPR
jgi:hypothetical protein